MSWLNKGQQVLVDEQSWVEFEIGEYKDKILCDVIPMDACHLLLGHPWKYDVQSQHDGKTNSFLITKNGRRYKMDTFPDESVNKHIGSSVMLVSGKEFLDILKEEGTPGYALILKPKKSPDVHNHGEEEVPKEVQQLLKKYKGIMVEEMPNTFPPIRDIIHQIDLILGSTLPNKPTYKMPPS